MTSEGNSEVNSLKRKRATTRHIPYTQEEEAKLTYLRDEKNLSYPRIAEQMPGRTKVSLKYRYNVLHDQAKGKGKGKAKEEGQALLDTIHHSVGFEMSHATKAISPTVKFSEAETESLKQLKEANLSWPEIADRLPGRSIASLKNKFLRVAAGRAIQHEPEPTIQEPQTVICPEYIIPICRASSAYDRTATNKLLTARATLLADFYLKQVHHAPGRTCGCQPSIMPIGIIASSNVDYTIAKHDGIHHLRTAITKTDGSMRVICICNIDGFTTDADGLADLLHQCENTLVFVMQSNTEYRTWTASELVTAIRNISRGDIDKAKFSDVFIQRVVQMGLNKIVMQEAMFTNKRINGGTRNGFEIDPDTTASNIGLGGSLRTLLEGPKLTRDLPRRNESVFGERTTMDVQPSSVVPLAFESISDGSLICIYHDCTFRATNVLLAVRHLYEHFVKTEVEICPVCPGSRTRLSYQSQEARTCALNHCMRHFRAFSRCTVAECHFAANMDEDFEYHFQQIHQEASQPANTLQDWKTEDHFWTCHPCNKSWKRSQRANFKRHQKRWHEDNHSFHCTACGDLQMEHDSHVYRCKSSRLYVKCDICGETYPSTTLAAHRLRHKRSMKLAAFAEEAGIGRNDDLFTPEYRQHQLNLR